MAPDSTASHPSAGDPLAPARRALDHGDYGLVLRQLEPLVEQHPPSTPLGAQLQLMMATAWMGLGWSERAIACCRRLRGCGDAALRAQARELETVLEAPVLRRPREWSLTLPALAEATPLEGRMQSGSLRRRRTAEPELPPPPPVGPTRLPIGFALVVLVVLAALAFLLGGCMQVRAELQFHGPGRLQVAFEQHAPGGRPTPWQRQFSAGLKRQGLTPVGNAAEPRWQSEVLPARDALDLLARNLEQAARLAGVSLPPPVLELRERNWLVGVRQQLSVELDLQGIEPLPGLEVRLDLEPLHLWAVRLAEPEAAALADDQPGRVLWPLRAGALNRLKVASWRWSPLGLGSLLIGLALLLVSLLARLRLALGFGLPELPA
ncbi:DUF3153 domain-containing protein [Synechococcus sp. GFB01]|uniref:DUF3153 domain-containing protein n=1 Tax=Synechococcus sp. GFB01 TaxID=1662190 RepID=UPI00064F69E9|nr:DUF3153 domain-containing protein [Synechococcus sp. GFB01]KMM18002.1 hypothetical protein SYNGFB01_00635 [Synechococcus sp. GFB01]